LLGRRRVVLIAAAFRKLKADASYIFQFEATSLTGFPDSLQIDPCSDAFIPWDVPTRFFDSIEVADHRTSGRRRKEDFGELLKGAGQLAGAQIVGQAPADQSVESVVDCPGELGGSGGSG
jgi:hypothetical protein